MGRKPKHAELDPDPDDWMDEPAADPDEYADKEVDPRTGLRNTHPLRTVGADLLALPPARPLDPPARDAFTVVLFKPVSVAGLKAKRRDR